MEPFSMCPQQKDFLTLAKVVPARLTMTEAAWLLGFHHHDMPILIAAGILRPLGNPSPNSTKYLATVEIDELRQDKKFLDRATRALQAHWTKKNNSKGHRNGQNRTQNPGPLNASNGHLKTEEP
jgi:hypothetical protein